MKSDNTKVLSVAPVFPGDAAEAAETSGADQSARHEAKEHGWRVLSILSALMGFASISTDVYLPAMPTMGQSLGANPGLMEWTVSGYLIGFSLGQLFWGVIGDRYGRRLPVAIGIVLFIIGSAGCALSHSAAVMIGWRVIQALGACASVVLSRAMVRDLYQGHRAAQVMSSLLIVMAIAPLVGPLIGGEILSFAGWRAIFWFLVAFGVASLAALTTLPETLAKNRRNAEPLRHAIKRYGSLLKDRNILAYAGSGGFFFGGVFAYVAGTPFVYITYYHLPPQYYGLVFGVGIMGIMAANFVNAKLVRRIGSVRQLKRGVTIAAMAGILSAIAAGTGFGGLTALVIPLFLFTAMSGFIVANSIAGALENFPERAGAVSALVGALQYSGGMIGSMLVGAFADGTPWPLGAVMAIAGIGSFLCSGLLKNGAVERI